MINPNLYLKTELHCDDDDSIIDPIDKWETKKKIINESDDEYNPRVRKQRKNRTTTDLINTTKTPSTATNGQQQRRSGRTWACKKCPSQFTKIRLLREHRKSHHVADEDSPTKYNYKFDDRLGIFTCNTCDAECASKEEAEAHVAVHDDRFVCVVCGEAFAKPYNYATHLYEHSEDKVFRCPLCAYQTRRRTCLLTHINRMHLLKFPYRCETCGKGFTDVVLHREHVNEHLGLKPFVCVVCGKGFPFSRYLFAHQVRNHRVGIEGEVMPNQCTVCLRIFAKVATMEKHFQTRHLRTGPHEKRHLCDICGKGFAAKDKLKVHYRVHTGIKPYACSYCEKSFTKKDYLIMHERVHSGEKPYSCEYCGKCFNQGAPLRIHVRSHTGERPYVCHICQTGYISKGALNIHLKSCQGHLFDD